MHLSSPQVSPNCLLRKKSFGKIPWIKENSWWKLDCTRQQEEALPYFGKALQLDTLRFRADKMINTVIKESGEQYQGDWLHLVDTEAALASKSSKGVPGDDFFWDHVHMKFQGNYLVALLTADWIAKDLQIRSKVSSKESLQWLSKRDAAKFLGLTLWNDYQRTSQMMQRLNQAPFNQMANHVQRMKRLQTQLDQQAKGIQVDAFQSQATVLLGLVRMNRSDWVFQDQFAKFLESYGHREHALTTWREVLKLVPHYLVGRYQLAMLLAEDSAHAGEAETIARTLIQERPEAPEFHRALGRALYAQTKDDDAVHVFRKAYELRKNDLESIMMLGAALEKAGDYQSAIQLFGEAIALNPELKSAHQSLASIYRRLGDETNAVLHEGLAEK